MRANEFVNRKLGENRTVNIPISITIPSDERAPVIVQQNNVAAQDEPQVDAQDNAMLAKAEPTIQEPDSQDKMPDEINGDPDVDKMVPPLQQELELEKADAGQESEVIDQITQDDTAKDDAKITPLSYR